MQPPSEADIISATDSLRRRKDAIDGQIISLMELSAVITRCEVTPGDKAHGMAAAISAFLRSHAAGLREDAAALESQIAYNDHVLQTIRSPILLPHLRPRKMTQQ